MSTLGRPAGGCMALLLVWLCVAGLAHGAGEAKGTTLGYSNLLVGRINPLGAKNDFKLHVRRSLFDIDHILFQDTYVGTTLISSLKPTAVFLGLGAELQPLAILRLSATVEWVRHLTTFDNVLSFPTVDAEHSDSSNDGLGAAGRNYATRAVYVSLAALLQAKVGHIVVRNDLKATCISIDLAPGDSVYYEIEWDLLAQDRSWVLFNTTDVLYLADFGLIAGVRYTLSHAFYDGRAYAPGEKHENPNSPTHRLGPLVGYSFTTRWEGFQKPTLLPIANWWLEHRYRTGQDVHQAVPYIVIAFAFTGDLI